LASAGDTECGAAGLPETVVDANSMAELVTASSQVLERALGESGRLETAGSDVMSGKQIVGRKNGASRTRPT